MGFSARGMSIFGSAVRVYVGGGEGGVGSCESDHICLMQFSHRLSGPWLKLGAGMAPLGIPLYLNEKSRLLFVAETDTSGGRVWKWAVWWWTGLSLSIRVPV